MKYLTLAEAAAQLGLSPDTLRIQVNRGKLKAVKPARDWLVTQAEVDRYAREHQSLPQGKPKGE